MIENFLRRPSGAAEVAADLVRVAGVVSIGIALIWFSPTDAGVLAFALPGLMVPRFLGVRSWFDITFCVSLLIAAWSNLFDLYTSIPWWDLVVHFVCTGLLAAVLSLALARTGVIAGRGGAHFTTVGAVLLTTAFGLALSAIWEMVEWFGQAFISDSIFVSYDDTISDMAIGGVGALCAGLLVALVPLIRPGAAPPRASRRTPGGRRRRSPAAPTVRSDHRGRRG